MIEFIDAKPSVQTAMALALLVALWVIARGLTKKSGEEGSPFAWDELLCEFGPDGKLHPSILRCVYAGAFIFSMWLMVYLSMQGYMSPSYMLIFNGSWVLPLALFLIWGKKFTPEVLQKLVEAVRGAVPSPPAAPPAPRSAPPDDEVRR